LARSGEAICTAARGREGLLDHRQQRRVGRAAGEVIDGLAACRRVVRQQAQAAQCRLERAAHAVVVGDILGVVGQLRGLAGDGIDDLVVVDDEDAGGGGLHRIVEQRLRECAEAGIAPGHRILQGRDARIAVTDGNRACLGCIERPGGSGDRAEHRDQRDEGTTKCESPHHWLTFSRARPSCPCLQECTGSTAAP
jgi:hypothetical protein